MSNPRKPQFHYYQGFYVIDPDVFAKEEERLETRAKELQREAKRLDYLVDTEEKMNQWMRALADPTITPQKAQDIRHQIESLDYWKEAIQDLKKRYSTQEIADGAYDKIRNRLLMDRISLKGRLEMRGSEYYREKDKHDELRQKHLQAVEENWNKQERKYIKQFQKNTWSTLSAEEKNEAQSPQNIPLTIRQMQALQLLRQDALENFVNLKTRPIMLTLSEHWDEALSDKDRENFISTEMLAHEIRDVQSIEDREQVDIKEIFTRKLMAYLCRRWNDLIENSFQADHLYIDKIEWKNGQLKIAAAEVQASYWSLSPTQITLSADDLAGKAWRRSFSRWMHLTEASDREPFLGFMDTYRIETAKSAAEATRIRNEVAEKMRVIQEAYEKEEKAKLEERERQRMEIEQRRSEDYLKSHQVEIFEDKFSQDRQERSLSIRESFTIPLQKAKQALASIDDEANAELSSELENELNENTNIHDMRMKLDDLEEEIMNSYAAYTRKLGELESHYDLALIKVSPQGAEETIKQYPQLFSNILASPLRAAVGEFTDMLSRKKEEDRNKVILVFNKLFEGVLKLKPHSSGEQLKQQLDAQINLMAENRDLIAANINQILSRKRELKMMSAKGIHLSPFEMMSSAFNFVDMLKNHLTENVNMMQEVSPFIMDQSGSILIIDREKLETQVAEEHISRLNAEQHKIKKELESMQELPQELLDKLLLYQVQVDAYVKVIGDTIDTIEAKNEEKQKQQEALEQASKLAEEEKAKAIEAANLRDLLDRYSQVSMDIYALARELGGKDYYLGIRDYSLGNGSKVNVAKELAHALGGNIDLLLQPFDASTSHAYTMQINEKMNALINIIHAFQKADSAMGIKHARQESNATTEEEVSSDEEKQASIVPLKKGWKGATLTIFGKVSLKDFSNKFHSEAEANIRKIIKLLKTASPSVSPDRSPRTRSPSLKRNSDSDS